MLKLPQEEAKEIVWEDAEDWVPVMEERLTDQGRWSTSKERVFMHIPTRKFYLLQWEEGSTEMQETDMFYDDPVEIPEIEFTYPDPYKIKD